MSSIKMLICRMGFGTGLLLLFIFSCTSPGPVVIGFIGGLSGRVADLGVSGRNGVMLAIEQQNDVGGINKRPITLVVRDDAQDRDAAQKAMAELLALKPEVIIGPMTSSMAEVILPMIKNESVCLISPTVTTTDLSGIDDQFLRVISSTRDYAGVSARYHYHQLGYRKVSVCYDLNNQSYTQSWFDHYRQVFESLGGTISGIHRFRSSDDTVFYYSVKQLLNPVPDCLLIIANAVDAALVSHQARKIDPAINLAMSEWASTERLIDLGGDAVEGAHVSQFLDRNDPSEAYQLFREAYLNRFGQEPGFAGMAGYDAALVALAGLLNQKPGQHVKDAILKQKFFQCVQQLITIDAAGDANRSTYMTRVDHGEFITLKQQE